MNHELESGETMNDDDGGLVDRWNEWRWRGRVMCVDTLRNATTMVASQYILFIEERGSRACARMEVS